MGNVRVWLFRVLGLTAAGLFLWSWFKPWWSVYIYEVRVEAVVVRPWVLESYVPKDYAHYISSASMPAWFGPAMWIYLGLCIAAIVYSLFFKGKEIKLWKIKSTLPSLIMGVVGFSYMAILGIAVAVIATKSTAFFDTPLVGDFFIELTESEYSDARSQLLFGYWLACGVGPLLIVLALLRNKIIGNKF